MKAFLSSGLKLLEYTSGMKIAIYNRPIWFLFSLFIIKCIFRIFFEMKKNTAKNIYLAVMTVLSVAFVFLQKYFVDDGENLVLVSVGGVAFFALGNLLKKQVLNLDEYVKKKSGIACLIIVLASAAYVLTVNFNRSVNMLRLSFGNPIMFYLGAFLGIFVVLIISAFISDIKESNLIYVKKILCYYGVNSMVVLVTHIFLAWNLLPALFRHFGIEEYLHNNFVVFLELIAVMILLIPIISLFNNKLYYLIGRKKAKKVKSDN